MARAAERTSHVAAVRSLTRNQTHFAPKNIISDLNECHQWSRR